MDWLAVVDVVAEASVLDAYDALVLAQVSRSCLPPARRACYRRFGGGRVAAAPYLCDVAEASLKALDDVGLAALGRLVGGGGGRFDCVLDRVVGCSQDGLVAFAEAALAARCERLTVRGCFALRRPASLAAAVPRLRALSLERCGQLSDGPLVDLVHALPASVTSLSVAGASVSTTDAFLYALAAAPAAARLDFLDVTGLKKLTASGVARLGRVAARLRGMRVDGCDGVDVPRALREIGSFPALESLHAKRAALAPGAGRPPRPGDLFRAIAARPGLVDVSLGGQLVDGPRSATRQGAARASAEAPAAGPVVAAPKLERLELQGAPVDAVAASLFAAPRFRLVALDLSAGARADPASLRKIASRLPHLRCLRLACMQPPLSDDALLAVVAALPDARHLKFLDVSWNDALSARGLRRATDACGPRLTLRATGAPRPPRRPRPARAACDADAAGAETLGTRRDAFSCATCFPGQAAVLCAHCATTCHAGHDVAFRGKFKMFCDAPTLCARHVPRSS